MLADCRRNQVVRKSYTPPAAITLNYSIKDIRNDVQQIIIVISYEKLQLNSLVWGSLTPAPIISSAENASTVVEGEVPGAPREWE